MTIDKTFDPAAIEARWYAHWEEGGLFRPARPDAEPFTIVIPPPNVTGSLHIGHALDNTLQDILVRHARLRGKDALWVVGTDHAGIATQMVVERAIASQGLTRQGIGREAFLAHVLEWKATSGGQITRQLRRLGASCDWANERFTMDAGFSRAVVRAFVQLHGEGLIYRDKRLVNWDPHFRTAISDLEVETREVQGRFWHLSYPLADGSGAIPVATTRPETMLADMAVAVHPDDPRYAALVGKQVRLPITGRLIPIVADDHADPALGSGAVKITPGHDFNDFEVGKRAGLKAGEMLNMLDAGGAICQTADGLIPAELIGLERFAARKAVVAMLEAAGALGHVEDRVIQTPYGDRSGVVIEPWLTDQWYVDAGVLAGPAIEAVRSGAIRVVPETWKKTWYQWLENIQPWCVSRQLWWGHQIPAWFGPDGTAYVAESEAGAQALAGEGMALVRDEDVLDTWFSSSLWPFGTLGWPNDPPRHGEGDHAQHGGGGSPPGESLVESPLRHRSAMPSPRAGEDLLARHYPNDVLISGFDILFFWDARMAMQGLHFMGEVPWRTLYLHGLVRAPDGSKMSKSRGNTVDPLGLIDEYGADALRFTLAAMESQGRDIKLDERRVEGYRNFATKLWNAARFAQGYGIGGSATQESPPASTAIDKWIVAQTVKTVQALDLALADLRFDEAANTIYHFVWDAFCDWYLELIKPAQVDGERGEIGVETRAVAGWVLDRILAMLHPFMPFLTEELWHALAAREHDLIVAAWPAVDAVSLDPAAVAEVEWLIDTVREFRAFRSELNIPYSTKLSPRITIRDEHEGDLIETYHTQLCRMTGSRGFVVAGRRSLPDSFGANPPIAYDEQGQLVLSASTAQVVVGQAVYLVSLEGVIDIVAEKARLGKAAQAAEKERDALAGRLGNAAFVEKAKPEAVAKAREDHAAKAAEAERLRAALARLG